MKVQITMAWHNQTNATNGIKDTEVGKRDFGQLLDGNIKGNPSTDDDMATCPGCKVMRTLSCAKNQGDSDGIKNLIRDAYSDINKDILTEIDILLDEEKEEDIDLQTLNQLLDLCVNPNESPIN